MDNHSISPQRMYHQSRDDFLSELPLSIIHGILALVPIRDAVRTGIMSNQWRYIWTSLPNLTFDDRCASSADGNWPFDPFESGDRFKKFVSHALEHHKGPIHKFEASVLWMDSCPDTDNWLLCLSRKDIKELCLDIQHSISDVGDWFSVHSNLYSCQKLTHMELYMCKLDSPPPTFNGFLFLRHLVLEVYAPSHIIESIAANSPLLENLKLTQYGNSDVKISAPNLKYFVLRGDYVEIHLCAPQLVKFSVLLRTNGFPDENLLQPNSSVCNYTKLLGDLSNLENLSGYLYFSKYLSIGIDIEAYHSFAVFNHLKFIQLYGVIFQDKTQRSVVFRLIRGSPNLQMLEISTLGRFTGGVLLGASGESVWDSGNTSDFTLDKLRVVKMKDVYNMGHEIKFIKFLLKSSPVLEMMSLGRSYILSDEKWSELMTELGRYDRASPNAKILFNPNLQ